MVCIVIRLISRYPSRNGWRRGQLVHYTQYAISERHLDALGARGLIVENYPQARVLGIMDAYTYMEATLIIITLKIIEFYK